MGELTRQTKIFAVAAQACALFGGEALNKKGSCVMPSLFVFSARITQADDQLHGGHDRSPFSELQNNVCDRFS
jgi:hypothetical protein